MPRVVHFEIHASKPQQLVDFYSGVFGWKFNHMPQMNYWLIESGDGAGINGGLTQREGPKPPADAPVSTHITVVDVPNIDDYWKRALDAGATAALPKMAIPHVGYAAYLRDPDNNLFGLFQSDASVS
jgi:predicted enzyme related to lactoylglutathione lyase